MPTSIPEIAPPIALMTVTPYRALAIPAGEDRVEARRGIGERVGFPIGTG